MYVVLFDLRHQRYLVDELSCFEYDLWIPSHEISKMLYIGYNMKSMNYLERIALSYLTHMMSMVNHVAIGVETLRIDSRHSLKKEFTELICLNQWNVIIPNYQSSWLMSWLCTWSFDLRHQRHLMNGWSYFDYDLWICSHGISKILYTRYNLKSTNMIVWSRWGHLPSVFEEINSRNKTLWNLLTMRERNPRIVYKNENTKVLI